MTIALLSSGISFRFICSVFLFLDQVPVLITAGFRLGVTLS
jgi:hypothetical protein